MPCADGEGRPWNGYRTAIGYNYLFKTSPPLTLSADGDTLTQDLVLQALATVQLTVLRTDETPYTNAYIDVKHDFAPYFTPNIGYTNSAGRYDVRSLPEGTYTIRVKDGYNGMAVGEYTGTVAASDDGSFIPITIQVSRLVGSIEGHVYASDGTTPLPGIAVQVMNALDRRQMAATTSDTEGRYAFTSIAPGDSGFVVVATLPSDATLTAEQAGRFTASNESLTSDFVMPVTVGSVSGTVAAAGGLPIAGSPVRLVDSTGVTVASVTTSADGRYTMPNVIVRAGTFDLRAYTPSEALFASQPTAFTTVGEAITVDFVLPVMLGSVQGRTLAPDGQPLDGMVRLVEKSGLTAATTYSSDGWYSFSNVIAGSDGFVVVARWNNWPDTVEGSSQAIFPVDGATVIADVTIPVSVIAGSVTFADGTAVNSVEVFSEGSDGVARGAEFDGSGGYRILATPAGPFFLTAQDNESGLTAILSADLGDRAGVMALDVVLPAHGSVTGHLLRADGTPVTSTNVALIRGGLGWQPSAYTDDTGAFTFSRVPVGAVTLQSSFWNDDVQQYEMASGLVVDGQTLTLELRPVADGTLSGRLFGADGATPVASASLEVVSLTGGGPRGYFSRLMTTDAEGRYQIANVPTGAVYVTAWDPNDYAKVAMGRGEIAAGASSTVDLVLGNGADTPITLTGSDGFRYQFAYDGSIYRGGTVSGSQSSAYYYSYSLDVNDDGLYTTTDAGRFELGGRQIVFGPALESVAVMNRRVFVPPSGRFVRFLDQVTNPTQVPLPVTVRIYGNLDYSTTHYVVTPAATGNTYAVTAEGSTSVTNRVSLAHVFGGGGSTGTPTAVRFEEGDDDLVYSWKTVIAPGTAVAFLHFSVQRSAADGGAARIQAEMLVDLSDPEALHGLTDEEKSQIRNFSLTSVSAAVSGHVYTAGGSPVPGALVQVFDAATGQKIASSETDSAGLYSLKVFAGTAGIRVRALSPADPALAVERTATFSAGDTLDLDLTVPGYLGSIAGTVTAGDGRTAMPGARVEIAATAGGVALATTMAGRDGSYTFPGLVLRVGPFIVRAVLPGVATMEQSAAWSEDGQATTANFTLPVVWGTVQGTVFAGDGMTRMPQVSIELREGGRVLWSTTTAEDGTFRLSSVTVPSSGVALVARFTQWPDTIEAEQPVAIGTLGGTVVADSTLPLSVVSGDVAFADGAPVAADLTVFVQSGDGTTRWAATIVQGHYTLFGTPVGAFTLTAQHHASGLTATLEGQLVAATTPVALDVVMPPAGAIAGRVLDSSGTPVTNALIELVLPGLSFRPSTYMSGGTFHFPRVAVGPVILRGSYWDRYEYRDVYCAATGQVVAADTLTIDLTPVPMGALTVGLSVDGQQGEQLTRFFIRGFGAGGTSRTFTSDQVWGGFTYAFLPAGEASVWAWQTPGGGGDLAVAAVPSVFNPAAAVTAVAADAETQLSLVADGSATTLPQALAAWDGFTYEIRHGSVSVFGSGTSDGSVAAGFGPALQLEVNRELFDVGSGEDAPTLVSREHQGRQLVAGPGGDVPRVVRKIYVPEGGGFARYLDVISNLTAVPWPVDARVHSAIASAAMTRYVATPPNTNDTYAISEDAAPESTRPVVGFVFAGDGAGVPVDAVHYADGSGSLEYGWKITLQPGETVIFMHFAIQRGPGDVSGARAQAEALRTLTEPNALIGVSNEERGLIRNFVVR